MNTVFNNNTPVLDLGNGTALISIANFFKPLVDDLSDFGRIAGASVINSVYALGGKPLSARAILGWPADQLSQEEANQIMKGARVICSEAGIILSDQHHINAAELVFGLAVNGLINSDELVQHTNAIAGCRLYLTKPLGLGILATAKVKGLLTPEDSDLMLKSMLTLNKLGQTWSQIKGVKTMTEVTSIGLLGHLIDICKKSGLSAAIDFKNVPTIHSIRYYLSKNCCPPDTMKNWKNYKDKVSPLTEEQKQILADPEIGGGLLVAVSDEGVDEFESLLSSNKISARSFGWLREPNGGELIQVIQD